MKKTIKNLLFVLMMLLAGFVNAADNLDLKVNDQQNLIVELEEIEDGTILSLMDTEGEILFKNRFFEERSYKKVLDLASLPEGVYMLKLDKKYSLSTSIIHKKGEEIIIDKNAYEFVFKPSFEVSGDEVAFFLANPASKKVIVEILDKDGKLVGSTTSREYVIKRILDFSNVNSGEYFVKVKIGKEKFTQKLNVG